MSKEQYDPKQHSVDEKTVQESGVESQEGQFYPVEIKREKGGYTSGPILLTSEGEKRIEEGEVYDVLFQGKLVSCVVELRGGVE